MIHVPSTGEAAAFLTPASGAVEAHNRRVAATYRQHVPAPIDIRPGSGVRQFDHNEDGIRGKFG